MIVDNLLENKK